MPRLQTPQGYYTATEVKRLLNVSDAVIRSYAKSGKIKYIIPPGRKQGFYLKRDVDRIVNEISAFLHMDEESTDETTFGLAEKEDLIDTGKIGIALFTPGSDVSPEPPEWYINASKKNPEMDYVLKRDEQLLGYASIVPFKVNSQKIYKCLEVESL